MKQQLESLLKQALANLTAQHLLPVDLSLPAVFVEHTRDPQHGDFATNLALLLAKPAGMPPRQLAERIVGALAPHDAIVKVEIAGPGFINFFIDPAAQYQVIPAILQQGRHYGRSDFGAGEKIHLEFVSANPTGPLHVGHGRGAAYGSALANLLEAAGYEVHREYYVNDAGRQMDILAVSVWLRYLELCGEALPFPQNGYRGDYVRDIAQRLWQSAGDGYRQPAHLVFEDLPLDEPQGGDKEAHIDALIARAKTLLDTQYRDVFQIGLDTILDDIKDDLAEFGVTYQHWFSERQLLESGAVEEALQRLRTAGWIYERDGAQWFASSRFGDEKDRVVVRENGQMTYFASDIAYHMHKLDRGFSQIIDIWGADHHGYIPRVKAAVQALGGDAGRLEVLLVQFAVLYRGGEKVQMSTRSGEFVTLRQLRNEVGRDAARFFYVMRRSEQHMDFDLKLATSQTNDNPVYYVQYAHARICSVLRQLDEKGWERDITQGMQHLHRLTASHEIELAAMLTRYPEVIAQAARHKEPHQIVNYLRELATYLHTYYNAHQFLVEDAALRDARLNLVGAVKQVLRNGLELLGVTAPESM